MKGRKLLAVLLALTLAASLLTATASAAGAPTITADTSAITEALHPGDTFTVPVRLENNPGFVGYTIALSFNEDTFVYVSCAKGAVSKGTLEKNKDTGKVNFSAYANEETDEVENITDDGGILLTYTLRVKDGAVSGNYEIGVACNDFSNDVPAQLASTLTLVAGSVTVEAAAVPTPAAPTFTRGSLLLSDEIGVNFYFDFPEDFDGTGCNVVFTTENREGSVTVPYGKSTPAEGTTERYFTFSINALELNDEITATLRYGEGQTVVAKYSAMTYINAVKADSTQPEKLRDLVTALQGYGYYLQGSGWTDGRNHDAIPAPENAPDVDTAMNAVKDMSFTKSIGTSGIKEAKVSLTLNAKTVINVFVLPEDGVEVTSAGYTMNGEYYRFSTERIGPKNLAKDYTVSITTNDGTTDGTAALTASALGSVKAALNSGTLTEPQQLALAAYFNYYAAADAYTA